jgi:hypothetical protein
MYFLYRLNFSFNISIVYEYLSIVSVLQKSPAKLILRADQPGWRIHQAGGYIEIPVTLCYVMLKYHWRKYRGVLNRLWKKTLPGFAKDP